MVKAENSHWGGGVVILPRLYIYNKSLQTHRGGGCISGHDGGIFEQSLRSAVKLQCVGSKS